MELASARLEREFPGVAGRLGVPAKTISFLGRGQLFFSRTSANFYFYLFLPFGGVFVLFGGYFCVFWGCFCAFLFVCLFFARQREFLLGS